MWFLSFEARENNCMWKSQVIDVQISIDDEFKIIMATGGNYVCCCCCCIFSFIVESRTNIYKEMASSSPDAREYYSAALAPLQIEFVSGVPTKVKTLIRLMKYWRKTVSSNCILLQLLYNSSLNTYTLSITKMNFVKW